MTEAPPASSGPTRESAQELPVELLDLVYVLAITQPTHYLLGHLTLRGAAQAIILPRRGSGTSRPGQGRVPEGLGAFAPNASAQV
jgi:hypothetical protein